MTTLSGAPWHFRFSTLKGKILKSGSWLISILYCSPSPFVINRCRSGRNSSMSALCVLMNTGVLVGMSSLMTLVALMDSWGMMNGPVGCMRKVSLTTHRSVRSPRLLRFPMPNSRLETETMGKRRRSYWLLKTEPKEWSWEDQRSNGGISTWDGVRNRQAINHMKSMRVGDCCFFYHSGASDRRVVGVVKVVRPWYLSSSSGDGAVEVQSVGEMRRPVELREIKEEAEAMKGFALLKQPRLSVVPVPEEIWNRICEMGGGYGETTEEEEEEEDEDEEDAEAASTPSSPEQHE
ncbi:thymocyte nuclear protein 1 [Canna indica]|uniref:Thymocyte nuclear protein 1 n=1 Tax=Canna indica TaxID=4628 RepID=A0AAQ3QPB6_9LILI|nr:thymocyte nuclear protein 1 [Canna indica]